MYTPLWGDADVMNVAAIVCAWELCSRFSSAYIFLFFSALMSVSLIDLMISV